MAKVLFRSFLIGTLAAVVLSESEVLSNADGSMVRSLGFSGASTTSASNQSSACATFKPSPRSIVKMFCDALPDFLAEESDASLLRTLADHIRNMSASRDPVKRETAFRAAVAIPLLMLLDHKDIWCLLEKLEKTLWMYQVASPAEKLKSLNQLKKMKIVNRNVRQLANELATRPEPATAPPPPRLLQEAEIVQAEMEQDSSVDDIIRQLGF